MKLTRKLEHNGEWWAQREDGSWVRWNLSASAWEAHPTGPWPRESWANEVPDAPPGGGSWADWTPGPSQPLPEPAFAGGLLPRDDPLQRPLPDLTSPIPTNFIDEWWVRNFPPHSLKRLLFGICALPFAGALAMLYRMLRGQQASWSLYFFVVVAGAMILPLLWFSGVLKPADEAAMGATDDAAANAPPLAAPPQQSTRTMREFLIGVAIALPGNILFLTLSGLGDYSFVTTLAMSAGIALLVSLVVVLRDSIWSVVIFSVVAGLGVTPLLYLFLSFWSDGTTFFGVWIFVTVVAFVFALPFWLELRTGSRGFLGSLSPRNAPRTQPLRPMPMWVLMTGTYILMILSAATFSGGRAASEDAELQANRIPSTAEEAAMQANAIPPISEGPPGLATRDAAARQLFYAWRAGSRARAESVASEGAVNSLFATEFPPQAVYKGCGTIEGGFVRCVIEAPDQLLLMGPQSTASTFYIDYVMWVGKDAPIDYDTQVGQAGTTDY